MSTILTESDPTPEAKALIDTIIEKQEGGWKLTENANDPDGGWTYAGVTAKIYSKWMQLHYSHTHDVTLGDIQVAISEDKAALDNEIYEIYCAEYYLPLHLSELPASIRGPLFSCAVNCGVETAVSLLQTTMSGGPDNGLKIDGVLGAKTVAALKWLVSDASYTQETLLSDFLKVWMLHYINLVQENASAWVAYVMSHGTTERPKVNRAYMLEGWFNRVEFWR